MHLRRYGHTLIYRSEWFRVWHARLDYVTGSYNEDGDRINHSFPTPRIIIIPRDPVPGSSARLFSLSLLSLSSLSAVGRPNSFFPTPSVSREISLPFLLHLFRSLPLPFSLFLAFFSLYLPASRSGVFRDLDKLSGKRK